MTGNSHRIMVVEDHPALGRYLASVLVLAGWEVIGPVDNLDSAMDAIEQRQLDLAVIDRTLRGVDALPIAEALVSRGIGCVIVSGYSRISLPEHLRDLPFLEKPFTKEALLDAVSAIAARRP